MKTLEISVFWDKSEERLIHMSRLLAASDVNLRSVTVNEVNEQRFLRIIVEKPDIAAHILNDAGFQVLETTVLSVVLDDRPGAMTEVLELFAKESIKPEYFYSIRSGGNKMAEIIFKVDDPDRGEILLKKTGYSSR